VTSRAATAPPQLMRTFADATPIAISYFAVSWVFGVAAVTAGYPVWLPVAMCVFVYAGASQFAVLALMAAHASLPLVVLTTLLINARHILMSVFMARALSLLSATRAQRWLYGAGLTDESFAVHSSWLARGQPRNMKDLIAFNLNCHAAWIAGAFIGALCATRVAGLASFKLDYALTAMMLYVLTSLCDSWKKLASAVVAATVMTLLNVHVGASVDVFIAAFAGCGIGTWLKKRD